MQLVGIDFGQRRVGLARASMEVGLARPWTTLEVTGREDALDRLTDLLTGAGVDRIVMGLPLGADGSIGSAARKLQRLGRVLARRTGVEVVFQDEYASSVEARERAPSATRSGDDAAAAAVILQDYLDAARRS